jgi:hypothetical protein
MRLPVKGAGHRDQPAPACEERRSPANCWSRGIVFDLFADQAPSAHKTISGEEGAAPSGSPHHPPSIELAKAIADYKRDARSFRSNVGSTQKAVENASLLSQHRSEAKRAVRERVAHSHSSAVVSFGCASARAISFGAASCFFSA